MSRLLALQAGADVPLFKRRGRQLKELGLTESLEVGFAFLLETTPFSIAW